MRPRRIKNGYVYAAIGEKYIQEALVSIDSLRKHTPNAHITLFTDQKFSANIIDDVKVIDFSHASGKNWKPGTLFKVRALQESPYERTFFVDSDTFFCDACDELFDLLNYFHLLICHAPADKSRVILDKEFLDGYFPYNTGVIVFKNDRHVKRFLANWYNIYCQKFHLYPHDQTPFMEALLFTNIKTYILQSVYNFRIPFNVSIFGNKVKLLHGRSERPFQQVADLINSTSLHRAWLPLKGCIELTTSHAVDGSQSTQGN